jgi:hypothetical protein
MRSRRRNRSSAGCDHSMLKVGHEPTGVCGAAGVGPQPSGKVQCQDIEKRDARPGAETGNEPLCLAERPQAGGPTRSRPVQTDDMVMGM